MSERIIRYSGEKPVPPIPEISYPEFVLQAAEHHGDQIAAVEADTKEEITYSQLVNRSRNLAAGLQKKFNLSKGQYVAIALPNCIEFPLTLFGVTLCGATAAFVNPIYKPRELDHVIGIIKPDLWICIPQLLPALQASQNFDRRVPVVVVGPAAPDCISFGDVEKEGDWTDFQAPDIDPKEDVATMPFSSGTTGYPKGVMLTHQNLIAAHLQAEWWAKFGRGSVLLAFLPFFHQYGCALASLVIWQGAKMVLMRRFGFVELLQALQDYQVTDLPLVPPVALQLCKNPLVDKFQLHLKRIVSSAASLGEELEKELSLKMGCIVQQGYGMTECTLATHYSSGDQRKTGSVGTVMPYWEVKVTDVTTNESLGPNQVGEICVRGPMRMKGYRGDPGSSAAILDSEGWLRTGDIAYYDEDGAFFIKDRLKELIKYKGNQVAPSELEDLLLSHEDIADAAVIGVPDEESGELPRAYIVKRPDTSLTAQQVQDFVAESVAPFKKLRGGVIFIEAIPKSASGKILRRELVNLACSSG